MSFRGWTTTATFFFLSCCVNEGCAPLNPPREFRVILPIHHNCTCPDIGDVSDFYLVGAGKYLQDQFLIDSCLKDIPDLKQAL